MGIDHDACNTCLVLGLGFPSKAKKPTSTVVPSTCFEPFLSLSLSAESYQKVHEEPPTSAAISGASELYHQVCPPSVISSFSSGRIKRERYLSSEEVEIEKNSCRISDEDEDDVNARKKLRLTKEQSALLEESFKQHSTLNPLKQTEVDCEFLKKCCDALTNENKRLQKELQELKALAVAQPFYMSSTSTLKMCPSCERIGDGGSRDGNSKNPFLMPSKSRFYNSVTYSSAAG